MAAPKTKTPEQLLARRQQVSELYLQCRSMAEIGRQLGISATQVYRDICWAREQWRTRAADAIEKHKERELVRIDHLELEAWKAWSRSIGRVKTTKTETGTGPQGAIDKISETIERKAGDPRFLEVVNKCIESRRKILGLDAPVKSEMTVTADELMSAIAAGQSRLQRLPAPPPVESGQPGSDTPIQP